MEENKKVVVKNTKKPVKKAKKQKKDKAKKPYVNPYKTTWGQILIWILCIAMVAGSIGTLIYLIVVNNMHP